MILDTTDRSQVYAHLHPGFAPALDFLRRTDLAQLSPGRHEISGDHIYVSIDHVNGRGRDGARLECHRAHIDIQVAIESVDIIGWMPLASCVVPDGPFDPARDVGLFSDRPDTWPALPPGRFAIFFPDDAHAPLAGTGPVKKAIVKIRA
jgi:biofilm protein TabA